MSDDVQVKAMKSNKILVVVVALTVVAVLGGIVVGVYFKMMKDQETQWGSMGTMPLLKPSVEETVPSGFKPPIARRRSIHRRYNPTMAEAIHDRLFTGAGPTDIYGLLDKVDERVQSLNTRSGQQGCLDLEPVKYTVEGWPGETLKLWIQCYEVLSNEAFLMWGYKDGIYYLYDKSSVVRTTAFIHKESPTTDDEYPCCYQVNGGGSRCKCVTSGWVPTCYLTGSGGTPIAQNGDNCRTTDANWPTVNASKEMRNIPNSITAAVNIYLSVGANYNDGESGSIANIHLEAEPGRDKIQATFGGIGVGFCGVQFVSYDDKIYAIGSMDGVGGACEDVAEVCTSGDLATTYTGTECDAMGCTLIPLGRTFSASHKNQGNQWAGSEFPTNISPSVNINYTSTNNGNTIKYGPETVPPIFDSKLNFLN